MTCSISIRRGPLLRAVLVLVGGLLLGSCATGDSGSRQGTAGAATDPRPNLVFIMADDLGWADLSSYGRTDYQTPHIDHLAVGGVRFTQAYSIAAVCTTTRVGFMTGRYPERHPLGRLGPITSNPRHRDLGLAPDPERPTVPALLAEAGYDTALIGKWHLGTRKGFRPGDHGFRYFFGNLAGHSDYIAHLDMNGTPNLFRDEKAVSVPGYLTDLYSQEASDFVARAETPFFLSLQYTAPHWPYQQRGDPPMPEGANFLQGGSLEKYTGMVGAMDEGVGRVLRSLEARGVAGNTLVIFASDNGGELYLPWGVDYSDLGGLAGDKAELWEGGIRVPTILRWPGQIPAGEVSPQVISTLDLSATLLAAADISPGSAAPLDGTSLLPLLRGEVAEHERTLFWRSPRQEAVRSGRWKYLRSRDGAGNEATWTEHLFDLDEDPGERRNLAEEQPDRLLALREKLSAWKREMGASSAGSE